METIQVVLDSKLLRATDRAARHQKVNRSALIREAIREHLQRMRIREMEERERAAYLAKPQSREEIELWKGAAWPDD